MIALLIPICDAEVLKARLYDEYRIEVPIVTWNDWQFVRVSIQGYNTREDVDAVASALTALL
jgi:isopenicillin-N epimerase